MVVVPALSAHSVRVVQDKELPLLLHLLIVLGRVRGVEDQILEWGGGGSPQPHPDGGPGVRPRVQHEQRQERPVSLAKQRSQSRQWRGALLGS